MAYRGLGKDRSAARVSAPAGRKCRGPHMGNQSSPPGALSGNKPTFLPHKCYCLVSQKLVGCPVFPIFLLHPYTVLTVSSSQCHLACTVSVPFWSSPSTASLTDHAGVRLTFSNLYIPSFCIDDKKHNSGHFPHVLKNLQVLQFLFSLSEGSKETLQLQQVQTLT